MTGAGYVDDPELYARIRRLVPIACIDVLPVQDGRLGLIRRDVPGGQGWNMVGGAVVHGETLADALARHVKSTLGDGVSWTEPDYSRPDALGEYFPDERPGFGWDPRKHAIATTYCLALSGPVDPRNEARDFRWFDRDTVPPPGQIGFGQWHVIEPLARRLWGG